MRGASNKMRSSDIDIFIALYTADRAHLRLSPIGDYHVWFIREMGKMYPYN